MLRFREARGSLIGLITPRGGRLLAHPPVAQIHLSLMAPPPPVGGPNYNSFERERLCASWHEIPLTAGFRFPISSTRFCYLLNNVTAPHQSRRMWSLSGQRCMVADMSQDWRLLMCSVVRSSSSLKGNASVCKPGPFGCVIDSHLPKSLRFGPVNILSWQQHHSCNGCKLSLWGNSDCQGCNLKAFISWFSPSHIVTVVRKHYRNETQTVRIVNCERYMQIYDH